MRDEFLREKKNFKKKKQSKSEKNKVNIFIAMGGTDHSNINIDILKVLKKFKNIEVNLATTTANKNLKELKNYSKNKKWIKLHINSNAIAKLMAQSDFGIITPSVTANEAYFIRLPFIAIQTAKNQDEMYNYLKEKRFIALKKFHKFHLLKILNLLLIKVQKLRKGNLQ